MSEAGPWLAHAPPGNDCANMWFPAAVKRKRGNLGERFASRH
jgi:hypothetical protein